LVPFAPLHQPLCLRPVRFIAQHYPELAQVACFDTDFHSTITPPANIYALPSRLADQGIRRYGFHGLSFQSIADQLRLSADKHILDERIIIAHLGSGASLCALRNLESIDTTMGFSTLDGLVMGTRPGALDPGIILYLMTVQNYSAQEIETLLYRESGLLGVSGISADVQVLLASPEPAAKRAIELFVFQAARQVAALAATLGGLDRLIFTGGIGEHSSVIRGKVDRSLKLFDIQLDVEANKAGTQRISLPDSPVIVEVRPAREEHVIAKGVRAALHQ
jgi:acetate kinase